MTSKQSDKPQRPEHRLATLIYDTYKAAYGPPSKALFGASRQRLREILQAVQDEDEVELMVLVLLDLDKGSFSAGYSLGWGSYERVRGRLRVPEGAWRYHLWLRQLDPGPIATSVNYWLSEWYDASEARPVEEDKLYDAQKALETLWEHNHQEVTL